MSRKARSKSSSSTTTKRSATRSVKRAQPSSGRKPINARIVESLHAKADLFEQRNKIYGDNFLNFGKVMKGIFPRGITLDTEVDFNRFCIFVQTVSKTTRYGHSFKNGHKDSMEDTAVYAIMQAEYDVEVGLQ